MKRVLCLLLVLAMVLVLLPSQPGWATQEDPVAEDCDHPEEYVTPATCVSPAYCAQCQQYFGEVDPDGHCWDEGVYIEPTCVSQGYWLFTCQYDETHTFIEEDGDSEIDPNNHDWSAWESTADGKGHTHTCQRQGCQASETFDHTGGEATCVAKAVCAVCNAEYGEIDENGHLWAEEPEYVEPTCASRGYWLFICQYDETHTSIEENGDFEIDPNNHDWSAWEPTADGTGHTRN